VLQGLLQWGTQGTKPIAILTGSAGTGKTTLLKAVVDALQESAVHFILLAPTGRAARILASKTGYPARTIHSLLYRPKDADPIEVAGSDQRTELVGFTLNFSCIPAVVHRTVFIVDEASMVSDERNQSDSMSFGYGTLLGDLFRYAGIDNSVSNGSRVLFVGDPFQLPPVRQFRSSSADADKSPALSDEYITERYGFEVLTYALTTIHRQSENSPILENAKRVREWLDRGDVSTFFLIDDNVTITKIDKNEAIDSASQNTTADSIIITKSNSEALSYNQAIRDKRFNGSNLPIQAGDILLICRNLAKSDFFNGDLLEVISADSEHECHSVVLPTTGEVINLTYRNIEVRPLEIIEAEVKQCKILENALNSVVTSIGEDEAKAIQIDFSRRHQELRVGSSQFMSKLLEDPYYNALVVKYGYAITCHKAQGGEWDKVTVHFEQAGRNVDFFKWAYTAITRSQRFLNLVNTPFLRTPVDMPP